jgi:hypothetical protein
MQTVEIRLWDDLEAAAGSRVPSSTWVTLEYGTEKGGVKRVRLDLTAEHEAELSGLLAPYLAAGSRPDQASPKAAFTPGSRTGSTEARAYFAGLREWAEAEGRLEECYTTESPGKPRQYYYHREIRQDYEKHLLSLAGRQAC